MWGNGFTLRDVSTISDMMTCLKELKISDNQLGDDGVEIISEGILRVLDIGYNEITATGATTVANSLLYNTSLEVLDISHNAIGQDGAIAIIQAIANNKTLKKLYL